MKESCSILGGLFSERVRMNCLIRKLTFNYNLSLFPLSSRPEEIYPRKKRGVIRH